MKVSVKKTLIIFFKEMMIDLCNLFFGHVQSKIGCGLLLILISGVCIVSPVINENGTEVNPLGLDIFGYILSFFALLLFISRFRVIRSGLHKNDTR